MDATGQMTFGLRGTVDADAAARKRKREDREFYDHKGKDKGKDKGKGKAKTTTEAIAVPARMEHGKVVEILGRGLVMMIMTAEGRDHGLAAGAELGGYDMKGGQASCRASSIAGHVLVRQRQP